MWRTSGTLEESRSLAARPEGWVDEVGPDVPGQAPEGPGEPLGQFLSPYQELEHLRHEVWAYCTPPG